MHHVNGGNGIAFVIRNDEGASIGGYSQACGRRTHKRLPVHQITGVAQGDCGADFCPLAIALSVSVYVVVGPASDVEPPTTWAPHQPAERPRHKHDLGFDRHAGRRDVINKDVLTGIRRLIIPIAVQVQVEAAGEDQQRLAIGADGCRLGAVWRVIRIVWEHHSQRLVDGPRGGIRGDAGASR